MKAILTRTSWTSQIGSISKDTTVKDRPPKCTKSNLKDQYSHYRMPLLSAFNSKKPQYKIALLLLSESLGVEKRQYATNYT